MTEMRCGDCQDMGCECPRGYFAGILQCDVCPYRFALSAANCAPIDGVTCPQCESSTTIEDG